MIEKKFQQFRKSITPQQFNNLDFLNSQADKFEADDPALAKRIRLRIQNLKKQKQQVPPHPQVKPESSAEKTEPVSTSNKNTPEVSSEGNTLQSNWWQSGQGV